jgi:DtxR family transcriptional regulator, Mn-dependent transcriptional regulator
MITTRVEDHSPDSITTEGSKDDTGTVWKEFEENQISHSAAHHLLAILELRVQHGYARVTDVARHLKITTGSASSNLKSLKAKGLLIEDENRFLSLSEVGQEIVAHVKASKAALYQFLTEILGVSREQAQIDSCKIEHLLSNETNTKLMNFIQSYKNMSSPNCKIQP